jgi:hypothetical protein
MQGGADRCYQQIEQFTGGTGDLFNVLTLTYASCNADLTSACMWTAVYTLGANERPSLGLDSVCTTGGPSVPGTPGIALNENGETIPDQRSPSIASNSFAVTPSANSPYVPGTCVTPTGPVNGKFRSYRVYCDKCLLPAEYRNLTTFDNRTTVPPPADSVRLGFEPKISTPTCEVVKAKKGGLTDLDQPYLVFWSGSTVLSNSCSGTPAFMAIGDASYCLRSVWRAEDGTGQLDMTFLSCSANVTTHVCAYSATYSLSDWQNPPSSYQCTTGTLNYQGQPVIVDGQEEPSVAGNTFGRTSGNNNAPFAPDTCYTPFRYSGTRFRSYKAYCRYADIPQSIRDLGLDVFEGATGPV